MKIGSSLYFKQYRNIIWYSSRYNLADIALAQRRLYLDRKALLMYKADWSRNCKKETILNRINSMLKKLNEIKESKKYE